MKILTPKAAPWVGAKVTCGHCGSLLELEEGDEVTPVHKQIMCYSFHYNEIKCMKCLKIFHCFELALLPQLEMP